MNSINERIKELRQNLHMSQEEFGKTIGLSKSGISNIESGARSVREAHIKLICSSFKVSANWLRTGKDLATEVHELEIFDTFLKSIGYLVDIEPVGIKESHIENVTDETGKTIKMEVADEPEEVFYHLTKEGKKTTFAAKEFDSFQREIENSVNFQVWKKQKNLQ